MTTFVIARVQTKHYEFEGVGLTPFDALAALELAWDRHKAQHPEPVSVDMFNLYSDLLDDVIYTTYSLGASYRDGTEIKE